MEQFTGPIPPRRTDSEDRSEDEPPVLEYRRHALWILTFYVPLVIVPWALTCVLDKRPVFAPSYVNQHGFSIEDVRKMRHWKTAIDVLNSIVSIVTIPVLSALLAQAAVVYTQRRKPDQVLSIRHMFALADRGWSDISIIGKSFGWREPGAGSVRKFILLATSLLLIGAIHQPIIQILVGSRTITVATCYDDIFTYTGPDCGDRQSKLIGYDIEPGPMAYVKHTTVLPRVVAELAAITIDEAQPHLWMDYSDPSVWQTGSGLRVDMAQDLRALRYNVLPPIPNSENGTSNTRFFVSAIETNSTTGVLRFHAMRLNSSVECDLVDREKFPSTCPGERPFTVAFKRGALTDIRVCVPGDYTAFPWTLSRNRQEIEEELFLDIRDNKTSASTTDVYQNVTATIHCKASTSRGYFELGNLLNNNTYGPLLEKWPSPEEMAANFNDVMVRENGGQFIPSEKDDIKGDEPPTISSDGSEDWKVAGPLMLSTMAMFGNASWFNNSAMFLQNITNNETRDDIFDEIEVPWRQICAGLPFGRLFQDSTWANNLELCNHIDLYWSQGYSPTVYDVLEVMNSWIRSFSYPDSAERVLKIGMFAANQATLNVYGRDVEGGGSQGFNWGHNIRRISTSPGLLVDKPVVNFASLIVVSTLVGLQLIGLAYLTYYIYHVPTWTRALDAMAIARIGASIGPNSALPPIGPVSSEDMEGLKGVSGLVGVAGIEQGRSESPRSLAREDVAEAGLSDDENTRLRREKSTVDVSQSSDVRLQLGGHGTITAKTSTWRVRGRRTGSF